MVQHRDIATDIIPEVQKHRSESWRLAAKNLGFAALHTAAIISVVNHEFTGLVIAAETVALAPRAGAAIMQVRLARKAAVEITGLENLQAQLSQDSYAPTETMELPAAQSE